MNTMSKVIVYGGSSTHMDIRSIVRPARCDVRLGRAGEKEEKFWIKIMEVLGTNSCANYYPFLKDFSVLSARREWSVRALLSWREIF